MRTCYTLPGTHISIWKPIRPKVFYALIDVISRFPFAALGLSTLQTVIFALSYLSNRPPSIFRLVANFSGLTIPTTGKGWLGFQRSQKATDIS